MRDAGNLIICKFLLGKNIMPKAFGRKLVLNDIPCSSIVYHSRHKKYGQWHGKYSGDFNAAHNLSQRLKPVWVDKVVAGTQCGPSVGVTKEQNYMAWESREIAPVNPEIGLLSIIIPVMNQAQYTVAIIGNIQQTVHIPYEIIIIDNGSTDETTEILEGVTVIRNERNVGMSRSWNQGCKAAQGSHLAILNNDLVLPDMWAEKLLEHGEHVVCPSYKHGERARANFEVHNKMLGRRPLRTKIPDRPGKHPNGFAGFCFLLSREAYDQVGPFDEQFVYWYGDNDYYIRLCEMGYEPVQSVNVEIHHFHSKTVSTLTDFVIRREKDRDLFDRKWPHAV
jgi:GT2 family glycosyltransferase